MQKKSKRPYGFVHDITKLYFTFHIVNNWFYIDDGSYSEEFRKRNGYKFDGQFFYKEK